MEMQIFSQQRRKRSDQKCRDQIKANITKPRSFKVRVDTIANGGWHCIK